MITAVVSTALSIVREKERGTMEQVRMAPLDAASFVVGKTIPYFVISLASALGHRRWRRWRCSGCRCAARGCCCCSRSSLFLVGALGLGLLISSVADTQQVAFQLALLVVVPADADAVGLHLSDRQHAGVRCRPSPTSCRRAISWSRCGASC